ncbi:MAG: protein kinase [archaeon]
MSDELKELEEFIFNGDGYDNLIFKNQKLLGDGSQGKVYLVKSEDKEYALKVIDEKTPEEITSKFEDLTEVISEHYVKVDCVGKIQDGKTALLMGYYGINLLDYHSKIHKELDKNLKDAMTYKITLDLLEALEVGNDRKIHHKDLTPEQVLIGNNNPVEHADNNKNLDTPEDRLLFSKTRLCDRSLNDKSEELSQFKHFMEYRNNNKLMLPFLMTVGKGDYRIADTANVINIFGLLSDEKTREARSYFKQETGLDIGSFNDGKLDSNAKIRDDLVKLIGEEGYFIHEKKEGFHYVLRPLDKFKHHWGNHELRTKDDFESLVSTHNFSYEKLSKREGNAINGKKAREQTTKEGNSLEEIYIEIIKKNGSSIIKLYGKCLSDIEDNNTKINAFEKNNKKTEKLKNDLEKLIVRHNNGEDIKPFNSDEKKSLNNYFTLMGGYNKTITDNKENIGKSNDEIKSLSTQRENFSEAITYLKKIVRGTNDAKLMKLFNVNEDVNGSSEEEKLENNVLTEDVAKEILK